MHMFEYILLMLGAVLVSSFIGARFPKLPTPLVQIATGFALIVLPLDFEVHLEPELFMVLFIAPLLFDDAKKADKSSLWRLKFPVLWLALGLVILTILVLGFAVNWFAPSIPLAAAFALAAALAPTDAVSVGTLKQNAKISDEQGKLLQGESLLNDASSIVSFNFAIAAAVTGIFSVWEAEGVFLIKFLGGLGLGVVVMLARYALLRFLRARGMESISFHVLFEIITPFLVYLLAEIIGVSGIIAVVAAGIAHSFAPRIVTPSSARLNVVSGSVWSVIAFTLNGLVFLMLGTQLPFVAARVWTNSAASNNYLLLFIVLIFVVIVVMRFVWVLVMRRNVNLSSTKEPGFEDAAVGSSAPYNSLDEEASGMQALGMEELAGEASPADEEPLVALDLEPYLETRAERKSARRSARRSNKKAAHADQQYWKHHLLDSLVLSLAGVKGAITLAIMLSIPLTLDGTTAFPERDLLILLASGVILLSLLVANIVLPLIVPKKAPQPQDSSESAAILKIYRSVISELDASSTPSERSAVAEVIRQYHNRINTLKKNNCLELPREAQVRRYAIDQELANTQRLVDEGKVSAVTAMYYINALSHQLARIEHHSTLLWELKTLWQQFAHRCKTRKKQRKSGSRPSRRSVLSEVHALQISNYRYVIAQFKVLEPCEVYPAHTVALVRSELEQRLDRLESRWSRRGDTAGTLQKHVEERLAIEARALDMERMAISRALDEGTINNAVAKTLRDNVAMMELDIEDQLE